MTRASISLTEPNDDWIQAQIESKEFSSRSEVVNDVLRKAREQCRERDYIRAKLIASEQSVSKDGWDERSKEDILESFKEKARQLGKL
ncbi:ribbon-helix-helix domain-containing protein [Hellea balneolensis]|uniref:ribbon-helix-helix domain-containing protein n=1 Tax=Hellea balneolensis TaxID=287478 RepID=UPI00040C32DF|nr:type II toxin-antitoxin system ParD family antitoxin [Hellea balneolensis]